MENMTQEKMHPLTKWVIDRIEKDYKEDIALLIGIKGHSTNGDGHGECFDFFVPATERGNELSETFIIDGVGHDLYPRSWERLENSVNLDDMPLLLDQATILYARSEEDASRFEELKKRMAANLNNDAFVYGKALECMDKALEIYRSLIFEEKLYRVRSEADFIHYNLSRAVAFLNHTYAESPIYSEHQAYSGEKESRMYSCPDMQIVPDGFFANARRLLEGTDVAALKETVLALLKTTRSFILERKPAAPAAPGNAAGTGTVNAASGGGVDFQELADWYQEMSLTWRRIRWFCANGMTEKAYTDACYLQEEFLNIAEEFRIEELNLLDSFDRNNLPLLADRSNQLEKTIQGILADHGIKINSYSSVEAFLAARG